MGRGFPLPNSTKPSNRLAQLLHARGLRRGDHIAIFMENNPRYFDAVWAALRSGLYITPINRYLTGEEAAYIATTAAPMRSSRLMRAAMSPPNCRVICPAAHLAND